MPLSILASLGTPCLDTLLLPDNPNRPRSAIGAASPRGGTEQRDEAEYKPGETDQEAASEDQHRRSAGGRLQGAAVVEQQLGRRRHHGMGMPTTGKLRWALFMGKKEATFLFVVTLEVKERSVWLVGRRKVCFLGEFS